MFAETTEFVFVPAFLFFLWWGGGERECMHLCACLCVSLHVCVYVFLSLYVGPICISISICMYL